jgi:hypothetical protein
LRQYLQDLEDFQIRKATFHCFFGAMASGHPAPDAIGFRLCYFLGAAAAGALGAADAGAFGAPAP